MSLSLGAGSEGARAAAGGEVLAFRASVPASIGFDRAIASEAAATTRFMTAAAITVPGRPRAPTSTKPLRIAPAAAPKLFEK